MSTHKISATVTLSTLQCAGCSMTFAVPEKFMEDRRDDHGAFRCPRGHSNHYPQESAEERLQGLLEQEESRREAAEERLTEKTACCVRERNRRHGLKGAFVKLQRKLAQSPTLDTGDGK